MVFSVEAFSHLWLVLNIIYQPASLQSPSEAPVHLLVIRTVETPATLAKLFHSANS
jgi:hypothetical protein